MVLTALILPWYIHLFIVGNDIPLRCFPVTGEEPFLGHSIYNNNSNIQRYLRSKLVKRPVMVLIWGNMALKLPPIGECNSSVKHYNSLQ
jgi:hypothetical protein